MSRILLLALVFAPLAACGLQTETCGDTIQVATNYSYTGTEGVMVDDPCVVTTQVGDNTVYDYTLCCPEGYSAIYGVGTAVICEEDCGLKSSATADNVADAAYVVHGATDAVVEAVETLTAPTL